jgi:hypothetical protein
MNWFWLNIPLAAAFFGAWVGIPMWLVVKHPDRAPASQPVLDPAAGSQVAYADYPALSDAEIALVTDCAENLAGVS